MSRRQKQYLDNYLNSYCVEIPKDYEDFMSGGRYEMKCVFCEQPHDYSRVYIRDPISGNVEKDLDVYACVECEQHISALLVREWGIGQNLHVAGSEDGPNTRRNLLYIGLQFAHDVEEYYTYLHPLRDENSKPHHCYICDRENTAKINNWKKIQVPVNNEDHLTGGTVCVCPDCAFHLDDLDELYIALARKREIHSVECSCKAYYYITKEEEQYRALYPEETEWTCPECTYYRIDVQEEGLWPYYEEQNAPTRLTTMLRKVNRMCFNCLSQFKVDLSIDYTSIRRMHELSATRFLCLDCYDRGLKNFLGSKQTKEFSPRRWISFVNNSEYEVYVLRSSPDFPKLVFKAKTDVDDILETVSIAFREVAKLEIADELW